MEDKDPKMDVVKKSDRFIPWYFVAFFVGLAIWDGIFVYVATTTHTGVVTDKSYDRGINYNETIAAAEAQSALGWAGEIEFKNGQLASLLTDANGRAIVGARVDAHFFRPTQAGGDFTINLTEVSDGRYVSSALSAAPGQWEVRVFVEWKQKQFQTAERIVVPQQ
ncbi:MAG: FixH family protein [Kordiimonas sp.]